MKKRYILLLLLLVLGISIGLTALAQDTDTLAVGDTVVGELTADAPAVEYTFAGEVGDVVMILQTSTDFDSFLVLLDEDGNELASDDDGAGNLNAQIAEFALPADGTYTIIATSSRHHRNDAMFAAGHFSLSLDVDKLPPVVAQAGTIAIDESVSGELTEAAPSAEYTFEAMKGMTVTVILNSDDFDSYLVLLDGSGNELAADDDSAGNLDSQIGPLELPADGAYTILVDSSRHNANPAQFSSGAYTLALSAGGIVEIQADETHTIALGESVTDNLSLNTPAIGYTFEGTAGEMVIFSVTSLDFDSYLILEDPEGNEMMRDDDSGAGLNARIGPLIIPEDGLYTITVNSFGDNSDELIEVGEFTLRVIAPESEPLTYGDTLNGWVTWDSPLAVYNFSGKADDVVFITLETDQYYMDVELLTAASPDEPLAIGEYSSLATSDGLRIGPLELPEDGDYSLVISDYGGSSLSRFDLTIEQIKAVTLEYDEPLEVDITQADGLFFFRFEGKAGQAIDVTADSDNTVDTFLLAIGPDSHELAQDTDSGRGYDPALRRVVLFSDGMQYLILGVEDAAEDDEAATGGQVSLSLTKVEVPSLDAGPQRIELDSDRYTDVVTFTGMAGEEVRLTVSSVNQDTLYESYVTVEQAGEFLAAASVQDVTELTIVFTVPLDGSVNVTLEDYGYDPITLEISLERVPNA